MKHSELVTAVAKKTGKEPKNKELANVLGLTQEAVRSRAFRDAKYDYDEVEKIKKFYGIEFTDLEDLKNSLIEKRADFLNSKDDVSIDYYPEVFGSCGNGTFVLSEEKERISVPKKVIENFAGNKKYSVINAYGDSMAPFIQDRDFLIVEHYDGEQIKDNRVYVFRYGENIFVKRLTLNINQLVIKSDNSEYDTISLNLSDNADIQIIGEIVGLMRRMG